MTPKTKTIIRYFSLSLILVAVAALVSVTSASALETGVGYGTLTGLGTSDLRVTIMSVIRIGLGFLGVLAIALVVYAGFTWMTAGGNEEKITRAKQILTSAIIGLVIILSAFGIASFIINQLLGATGAGGGGTCNPNQCVSCNARCNAQGNGVDYDAAACGGDAYCALPNGAACPKPSTVTPTICKIEDREGFGPGGVPQGAKGEYVTVEGWYFGDYDAAVSQIAFDATPATIVACGSNSTWSVRADGYGLARVLIPDIANGSYGVTVKNKDAQTGPSYQYGIVTATASKPNLACIEPVSGTNNQTLAKAEGKQFGTDPGTQGGIFFTVTNDGTTQKSATKSNAGASYATWADTLIGQPVVPALGVSGYTYVADSAAQPSNKIYFTVSCQTGSQCSTGCCSGFSCQPAEACLPGVGESCDPIPSTPACDPNGVCKPGLLCGTNCTCREPGAGENCDTSELPSCQPGKCADDRVCGGSGCTCQDVPLIERISPNDGAPHNLVTINGKYFGTTRGQVFFTGASGNQDVAAQTAAEANPACTNSWTDTQIVVEIPNGAVDGPIVVINAAQLSDSSADARGPKFDNFDVNTTVRPGLCMLWPFSCVGGSNPGTSCILNSQCTGGGTCTGMPAGKTNQPVTAFGTHFSAQSQVYFAAALAGGTPVFDATGTVGILSQFTVPVMDDGTVGVRVKDPVSNQLSNALDFHVGSLVPPTVHCSSQPGVCSPDASMCATGQLCDASCQCQTIVNCNAGSGAGNSCSPDSTLCPSGYTCADGQTAGQQACGCYPALSCDTDKTTPTTCEPGTCPTGYTCDSSSDCTCQQVRSIDLNSTYNWGFQTSNAPGSCSSQAGACSPDSSLCLMNETCDPTTCNCAPIAPPACVNNDQAISLVRIPNNPQFVNFDATSQTYQTVVSELTGAITVAAWIKPPKTADAAGELVASTYEWGVPAKPAGSSVDGNVHGWSLGDDFDCHAFQVTNGTCTVTDEFYFSISDQQKNYRATVNNFYSQYGDKWVYVVGTFDPASGDVKLYVNGVLVATSPTKFNGPITYPTLDANKNLRIGARADVRTQGQWNGLISDVALYNTALSGDEIRYLSQFRTITKAATIHLGFNGDTKADINQAGVMSTEDGVKSTNAISFTDANNACKEILCDSDTSTPSCQPGDNCPSGFYCNPSSCVCNVGIACNNNTDTAANTCDPNDTFCPTAYSCDKSSCLCQPAQALSKESTYTWFFTTYTFGPTVVETCNRSNTSCDPQSISSPTPIDIKATAAAGYHMSGARPDDGAVPIDAIVQGMFSTMMYEPSLVDNIKVYPCGSAEQPFDANCKNKTAQIQAKVDVGLCNYLDPLNADVNCFTATPSTLLLPNQWYQVVLKADSIRGSNGVALAGNDPTSKDYVWVFKTRNDVNLGVPQCVYVKPHAQTAFVAEEKKDWTADIGQACIVFNPINPANQNPNAGWSWRIIENFYGYNPPRAVLFSQLQNEATTISKLDTIPNPPVNVFADYTTLTGAILTGTGLLTDDFNAPVVTDKFPDCGTACLNSKIGATFSQDMDATSVRTATKLYVCYGDASCPMDSIQPVTTFSNVFLDPSEQPNTFTGNVPCYDADGNGTNDYCLVPNAYYRVVIASSAQSLKGRTLGNLNFDSGSGQRDSYSWVFKTQENPGLCLPKNIDVSPNPAQAPVNVTLPYAARALSAPDSCEPKIGQRLNPYGWDWKWASTQPTVAVMSVPLRDACGNGVIEWGEDCDDGNTVNGDGCSNTCLNEGTQPPLCGNGKIDKGEECDTPGSNGCSSTCLLTGNTNYNKSVCGNGVVEIGEECDAPGQPGCSSSCLLAGTVANVSLCGDGQIGVGEECDDADLANGGKPQSGDGCSTQCLLENRNQSFCRSNATHRYDFAAGSCDANPSGCALGSTCAKLPPATGNTNTAAVCGDGAIEHGEECDIGGVCSDNGQYCTSANLASCANPATATCKVLDVSVIGVCSITHNACTNVNNSCVSLTGHCNAQSMCVTDDGTQSFPAEFCDIAKYGANRINQLCATDQGICQPRVASCTGQCLNAGSVYEKINPPTAGAFQYVHTLADGETFIQASVPPITGQAYLLVGNGPNDGKFRLVETWPGCNAACRDADLGGRFNKTLDINTIESQLVNPETVKLYDCGLDSTCTTTKNIVTGTTVSVYQLDVLNDSFRITLPPTYNPVDNDQNPLTPAVPTLLPNTYYRVVVDAAVKSAASETMANLNYAQTAGGALDAYSWVFQTRPESDLCGLDYVKVIPDPLTLPDGGVLHQYFAQPWSKVNSCIGHDQRLNPYYFDWRWSAAPNTGADFIHNASGQLMDGCGDGVVEWGEACDPGLVSDPNCDPVTCQLKNHPSGTNPGVTVPNPSAKYHFENNISDTSGNNVNPLASSAITFGSGAVGSDVVFNASSTSITFPTTALSPNEGTIMAWVKVKGYPQPFNDPRSGTYAAGHIIYAGVNGYDGFGGEPEMHLSVVGAERQLTFYYGGSNGKSYRINSPVVDLNTWHYVIITYKNSGTNGFVRMYFDGTLVDHNETPQSLTIPAFTNVYLGRSVTPTHRFFDGELDELTLYSTALSDDQIRSLGATTGGSICGNSVVDAGEQCDDGNTTNGYCSTDGQACNTVGASCAGGGQCIADGCSNQCLYNGSKDNRIDPYQIIKTVDYLATKVIEFIHSWNVVQPGRYGEATLTVVPSSPVPFAVIGHQPPAVNPALQCLNTAMWAVFSHDVKADSIKSGFKVCKVGDDCTKPENNIVADFSYQIIQGQCQNSQCNYGAAVDASNQYFGSCTVDADCRGGRVMATKLNTADGFLTKNTPYQMDVSGITSSDVDGKGQPLALQKCNQANTACAWQFRTNAEYCTCDSVGIGVLPTAGGNEALNDSFFCAGDTCGQKTDSVFDDDVAPGVAGNQHQYDALCYDNTVNGQPVHTPLLETGLHFDWSTTRQKPADVDLLSLSDPLSGDPYNGEVYVTPIDKNGQSLVTGSAHQYYCGDTPKLCDPSIVGACGADVCKARSAASQTVHVINFMCENPWPEITRFPYRDNESNLKLPDTNFELYYCRDNGADGFADDLPALDEGGPVVDPVGATILKDFIFPVGSGAGQMANSKSGDLFAAGSTCVDGGNPSVTQPQTGTGYSYCRGNGGGTVPIWIYNEGVPTGQAGSYTVQLETFNKGNDLAADSYCDMNNNGMLNTTEGVVCNPGAANSCGTGTCRVGVTHVLQVFVDGTLRGTVSPVAHSQTMVQTSTVVVGHLDAGSHTIEIHWLNDWTDNPVSPYGPIKDDSNLAISRVSLVRGSSSSDALGIRVLQNPLHLAPQTWYQSGMCQGRPVDMANLCFANSDCNDGNTTTPDICTFNVPQRGTAAQSVSVDGYPAIRDGRTVYVGATNRDSTNLFSNIYLISYNQDAKPETVEIFNRILDPVGDGGQWLFNSDFTYYENKLRAQRDAKRYGDLRDIQIDLNAYHARTGTFPALQSGSYIASTTFSVWPSWQQTFGTALGQTLPIDPVNQFISGYYCDANGNGQYDVDKNDATKSEKLCSSATDAICPPTGACRPLPDAELKTYWDQTSLQFTCPSDMSVYAYHVSNNGASYSLFSNFEYNNSGSWRTAINPLYTMPFTSASVACQRLDFELDSSGATPSPVTPTCAPGTDPDGDGICNPTDNCPTVSNPNQHDTDGNGIGDACDVTCSGDIDNDGVCDNVDDCRTVYNPKLQSGQTCSVGGTAIGSSGQCDYDNNGIGDACDPCTDRDGDHYADVNTGANDFRLCPLDNATCSQAAPDRRAYCLSAAGIPRAKVCSSAADCATGESCGQPQAPYESYNPFQEDYDNDGLGYICDQCIDYDNDGFGDYSFFTKLADPSTMAQIAANPSWQWHFSSCTGTRPTFNDVTNVQIGTTNLDNCPAGPYSAVCKDQFGITISCTNPNQKDTNSNDKGNICDPFGNGAVDNGEQCDCGESLPYSIQSAKQPFTCTSPNNPPVSNLCTRTNGYCYYCQNGQTQIDGVGCGDGILQSGEDCDAGLATPKNGFTTTNGVSCAVTGTAYGVSCNWCDFTCKQHTTFGAGGGCGDHIVQAKKPDGTPNEQCDSVPGCDPVTCQQMPGYKCDPATNTCVDCAAACTVNSHSTYCGQDTNQGNGTLPWSCASATGVYYPTCQKSNPQPATNPYCGDGIVNGDETGTISSSGVFCRDASPVIQVDGTWQVHLVSYVADCAPATAVLAFDDTQNQTTNNNPRFVANVYSDSASSAFLIEKAAESPTLQIRLSFDRSGTQYMKRGETDNEVEWTNDSRRTDITTWAIFYSDWNFVAANAFKYHVPYKICSTATGLCLRTNDHGELKADVPVNSPDAQNFEFRNLWGGL